MNKEIGKKVGLILDSYEPSAPKDTAEALRDIWSGYEAKSMGGIKAEERAKQETLGIPVPVLTAIGNEIGKAARNRVDNFVPLVTLLWDDYGREGRVVAVFPLGKMELANPKVILPLTMELCRSCHTWEDADQLAMRSVEPIVRKEPDVWLPSIEPWLVDDNRWVRRAGVTVVGRLPMKQPAYTTECLDLAGRLLLDDEEVVKKATSFAIRLSARGEIEPVKEFLAKRVPPADPAATWLLCDVIRSMSNSFMPEFTPLLPRYEQWLTSETISSRDRRSVESAVKVLRKYL
ncbi:MAG TPA: DNA alkylation repair protein [candidate division Zixibacteria bacterium]|nr:DNA alkylation repair protein [candidate division Zixibacteria bacterium]